MTMESTSAKLPLLVLLLNYFPVVYLVALAGLVYLAASSIGVAIGLVLLWIYLLPPLLCRLVTAIWGIPENGATIEAASFKRWWLLSQLQTFYNRFPALEEALRILPSCYSLWLCLWGSRVSPFVLWSPGVRVTDRYLLQIESQATLGWDVRLSPHMVTLNQDGEAQLIVGRIFVGRGAIVGGQASLGPGSRIEPGESFPATRVLGPFHTFSNGRRRSPGIVGPESGQEKQQKDRTHQENE